jgi:hypothetical protein
MRYLIGATSDSLSQPFRLENQTHIFQALPWAILFQPFRLKNGFQQAPGVPLSALTLHGRIHLAFDWKLLFGLYLAWVTLDQIVNASNIRLRILLQRTMAFEYHFVQQCERLRLR